MTDTPRDITAAFWAAMETNDFAAAALWLAPEVEVFWPQSAEIIRGRADFAAVNTAYPVTGRWRFQIHRILAEGAETVSDITVRDDRVVQRLISFATIRAGRIARLVEWWPDDSQAPAWRAPFVTRGRPPETPD